jgi:hypothetical protein
MEKPGGPVYVYGILASDGLAAIPVAGVDDMPVRVVEQARLAALVSDLHADALTAAREVRAHWRVLEAASDQGVTVIPVRFGTVMQDEQAVRDELLDPHADHLEAVLDRLAGRIQVSVKGTYDEQRLMAAVVRESPAIGRLRERLRTMPPDAGYYDRISLGEMVAAAVQRQREADLQLVEERLVPLAVDVRSEAASGTDGAFDIAFLVDRDRLPEFSQGVAALGAELEDRIAVRYVGPLPPYSFVDDELAAGVA